jgi:hypothetical protein
VGRAEGWRPGRAVQLPHRGGAALHCAPAVPKKAGRPRAGHPTAPGGAVPVPRPSPCPLPAPAALPPGPAAGSVRSRGPRRPARPPAGARASPQPPGRLCPLPRCFTKAKEKEPSEGGQDDGIGPRGGKRRQVGVTPLAVSASSLRAGAHRPPLHVGTYSSFVLPSCGSHLEEGPGRCSRFRRAQHLRSKPHDRDGGQGTRGSCLWCWGALSSLRH